MGETSDKREDNERVREGLRRVGRAVTRIAQQPPRRPQIVHKDEQGLQYTIRCLEE
jgi:hypothetical protein